MVLAIGPQTTDLPPMPNAVGSNPAIVVIDVNITGLNLVAAASITAYCTGIPCNLSSSMKLARTIVSLTAIPASATPANITVVDKGVPDTRRKRITPVNARGIDVKIRNGFV